MRDRRWRNRRLAADVAARVSATMAELNGCLRSGAMDFIDQARQARQKAIIVNPDLAAAMAAGLLGRGHLDGNEADPAACPRQIISEGILGDVTLLVGRARRHRRHHDAVGDFDRADLRRGEQDVHGMLVLVSRMRCSAERCAADPGPSQAGTVPGLQRITTQSTVRRLRKLICVAAPRPGHAHHSTGISPPSRYTVAPCRQVAREETMKVTKSATSSTLP